MSKSDKHIGRYVDELPESRDIDFGSNWVQTATQGTISSDRWVHDWNQMRARWHPDYFTRWNVYDTLPLRDKPGYVHQPQDYIVPMGYYGDSGPYSYGLSSCTKDGETVSASRSSRTVVWADRRCCTLCLILVGLLLVMAAAIPVLIHLLRTPDSSSTVIGRVTSELTLVKLNYTDEMANRSSADFRRLSSEFEIEMGILYQHNDTVGYFREARVNKLTKGSVVVNYDLYFDIVDSKMPTTNKLREVLYSVDRDKHDTGLGILGDLRFRIDSIRTIETVTVRPDYHLHINTNASAVPGLDSSKTKATGGPRASSGNGKGSKTHGSTIDVDAGGHKLTVQEVQERERERARQQSIVPISDPTTTNAVLKDTMTSVDMTSRGTGNNLDATQTTDIQSETTSQDPLLDLTSDYYYYTTDMLENTTQSILYVDETTTTAASSSGDAGQTSAAVSTDNPAQQITGQNTQIEQSVSTVDAFFDATFVPDTLSTTTSTVDAIPTKHLTKDYERSSVPTVDILKTTNLFDAQESSTNSGLTDSNPTPPTNVNGSAQTPTIPWDMYTEAQSTESVINGVQSTDTLREISTGSVESTANLPMDIGSSTQQMVSNVLDALQTTAIDLQAQTNMETTVSGTNEASGQTTKTVETNLQETATSSTPLTVTELPKADLTTTENITEFYYYDTTVYDYETSTASASVEFGALDVAPKTADRVINLETGPTASTTIDAGTTVGGGTSATNDAANAGQSTNTMVELSTPQITETVDLSNTVGNVGNVNTVSSTTTKRIVKPIAGTTANEAATSQPTGSLPTLSPTASKIARALATTIGETKAPTTETTSTKTKMTITVGIHNNAEIVNRDTTSSGAAMTSSSVSTKAIEQRLTTPLPTTSTTTGHSTLRTGTTLMTSGTSPNTNAGSPSLITENNNSNPSQVSTGSQTTSKGVSAPSTQQQAQTNVGATTDRDLGLGTVTDSTLYEYYYDDLTTTTEVPPLKTTKTTSTTTTSPPPTTPSTLPTTTSTLPTTTSTTPTTTSTTTTVPTTSTTTPQTTTTTTQSTTASTTPSTTPSTSTTPTTASTSTVVPSTSSKPGAISQSISTGGRSGEATTRPTSSDTSGSNSNRITIFVRSNPTKSPNSLITSLQTKLATLAGSSLTTVTTVPSTEKTKTVVDSGQFFIHPAHRIPKEMISKAKALAMANYTRLLNSPDNTTGTPSNDNATASSKFIDAKPFPALVKTFFDHSGTKGSRGSSNQTANATSVTVPSNSQPSTSSNTMVSQKSGPSSLSSTALVTDASTPSTISISSPITSKPASIATGQSSGGNPLNIPGSVLSRLGPAVPARSTSKIDIRDLILRSETPMPTTVQSSKTDIRALRSNTAIPSTAQRSTPDIRNIIFRSNTVTVKPTTTGRPRTDIRDLILRSETARPTTVQSSSSIRRNLVPGPALPHLNQWSVNGGSPASIGAGGSTGTLVKQPLATGTGAASPGATTKPPPKVITASTTPTPPDMKYIWSIGGKDLWDVFAGAFKKQPDTDWKHDEALVKRLQGTTPHPGKNFKSLQEGQIDPKEHIIVDFRGVSRQGLSITTPHPPGSKITNGFSSRSRTAGVASAAGTPSARSASTSP